jgi:PHD/YefM family antitoxin component YafN of YafNO toxin-antitoxin module
MRTINAREIKRRGIRAVDSVPGDGPVTIVARNDRQYVVIHNDRYQEC